MQHRKKNYPRVFAIGIHVSQAGGGPVHEAIKKVFCRQYKDGNR
jgi:hypothetical protein